MEVYFGIKSFLQPLGEIRISIEDKEYDINPIFEAYFTNTNFTTKSMDDQKKFTVFNILKNVGFYDKIYEI